MEETNAITISYETGVHTQAGWRTVTIDAAAEKVSAGMAVVKTVTHIDGEEPHYGMSHTGARRQSYNGKGIALREVGARKRLSACRVEEAA